MERSQLSATVDFDRPGKQHGHIRVPYSYDLGGWANLLLPVTVLGKADGTPTEMVAHYLTTVLFPLADIVIDIHTGGRSLDFYPCATMHLVPPGEQRRQMLEGTLAWGSDFAFLYTDIAGTGLLPVEAERQGKIVVTTEMGGGEPVSAGVHRLTQAGPRNVLVHFGIVTG